MQRKTCLNLSMGLRWPLKTQDLKTVGLKNVMKERTLKPWRWYVLHLMTRHKPDWSKKFIFIVCRVFFYRVLHSEESLGVYVSTA